MFGSRGDEAGVRIERTRYAGAAAKSLK